MSSSYSLTAYLPGPRNTYSDYAVKNRTYTSEATNHLDDCLKRTGRQDSKLENLNRTCEDNLDTCNMWYKNARKFNEDDDVIYVCVHISA